MMRLSDLPGHIALRTRVSLDPDAQRRKQYALAERIASASFDFGFSPVQWQLSFNRALREIQQFDKEFEEVRA